MSLPPAEALMAADAALAALKDNAHTSELPVTQVWAVSDWEMAKQQGFNQAIIALEQPAPELVEAVARVMCDASGCVWDFDPSSDARIQWYNDATAALAAAAAHLGSKL